MVGESANIVSHLVALDIVLHSACKGHIACYTMFPETLIMYGDEVRYMAGSAYAGALWVGAGSHRLGLRPEVKGGPPGPRPRREIGGVAQGRTLSSNPALVGGRTLSRE